MYGKRLKLLRKEKNWTVTDVAKKIDIGQSTYAGYETEYRQPPIEKLQKIADLYDVCVDYILGLTDERKVEQTNNIHEFLSKDGLHWDGVPLSLEDLKPIRDLLDMISKTRKDIKDEEAK